MAGFKQKPVSFSNNSIESALSASAQVQYEVKQLGKSFFEQIQGAFETKGDLLPGQEISFKKNKNTEQPKHEVQSIRTSYHEQFNSLSQKETQKEMAAVKEEVQQIVAELQLLAASYKELGKKVTEATGQAIVKPGKYHLSFLKMVLSLLQDTRLQIEESSAWLSTLKGKHNKSYWGMFKKHGTSFGLSGERTVSTQTA